MRPSEMNRLPKLCRLTLGLLLLAWPLYGAESAEPAAPRVNAERLQEHIDRLARIGGTLRESPAWLSPRPISAAGSM